jgi:hypothetical protein
MLMTALRPLYGDFARPGTRTVERMPVNSGQRFEIFDEHAILELERSGQAERYRERNLSGFLHKMFPPAEDKMIRVTENKAPQMPEPPAVAPTPIQPPPKKRGPGRPRKDGSVIYGKSAVQN